LNFRQNRALFVFDAAFAGIGTALPRTVLRRTSGLLARQVAV